MIIPDYANVVDRNLRNAKIVSKNIAQLKTILKVGQSVEFSKTRSKGGTKSKILRQTGVIIQITDKLLVIKCKNKSYAHIIHDIASKIIKIKILEG